MIGSAAQNIITLTDRIFLFHLSVEDFASIGFVSVFYLIVAAIGFGFSRGGQILIARRAGASEYEDAGKTFHSAFIFLFFLSVFMFLFMTFGCYYLFKVLVDSPVVFEKSLEYVSTRKYGVFFSYTGVALISLYTGIARPRFLIFDTFLLAVVNIVLDYALIFGHYGFPAMGIAGAGLASTLAEVAAFVAFILYMIWDRQNRRYRIFQWPRLNWALIREQYILSIPLVLQPIIGLGSWFLFMAIVENLGEEALAITILAQMVYLVLSIPSWGFAAGISTLVGGFIGHRKRQAVIPIILKTGVFSLFITALITLPVIFFPHFFLQPFLGAEGIPLITKATPVFYVLAGILSIFSIGSVIFSSVSGVGASGYALKIQAFAIAFYLIYIYVLVEYVHASLAWTWAVEIFYWLLVSGWSLWYLYSRRWHGRL
ncbi:MAG: MATE family efflux transporter [Bacteroidetes bacterium]|nr:MAG: MATE family efflux transporter [Bacteroidota bacterium]PTM14370.1 MAG: MATE family efflux transporter [Bacteroidota bacterium]